MVVRNLGRTSGISPRAIFYYAVEEYVDNQNTLSKRIISKKTIQNATISPSNTYTETLSYAGKITSTYETYNLFIQTQLTRFGYIVDSLDKRIYRLDIHSETHHRDKYGRLEYKIIEAYINELESIEDATS